MEEGPASEEEEAVEAMEEDGRMPGTDLALYGAYLPAAPGCSAQQSSGTRCTLPHGGPLPAGLARAFTRH
jgi:hypothetical protein